MSHLPRILALLAFTILTPALAWGQDEVDPMERAFDLNDRGIKAFQDGRFEDAATAFAEAYSLNRDETLRKNEAMAWFKAGRCDPAVAAANKFLLVDGILESDRSDALAVIANCKVEFARSALAAGDLDLAELMLAESESAAPDPVVRDRIAAVRVEIATERGARLEAERLKEAERAKTEALVIAPPEPEPAVWPLFVLGGGAATIGVTFAYQLLALSWQRRFLEMAENGGDQAEFDSLRKRVHTARVLLPVFYGIGVGAAAAGAWFSFIAEPPTERATSSTIGFAAGGRF